MSSSYNRLIAIPNSSSFLPEPARVRFAALDGDLIMRSLRSSLTAHTVHGGKVSSEASDTNSGNVEGTLIWSSTKMLAHVGVCVLFPVASGGGYSSRSHTIREECHLRFHRANALLSHYRESEASARRNPFPERLHRRTDARRGRIEGR